MNIPAGERAGSGRGNVEQFALMAPARSPAVRTTVYRLINLRDLHRAIRERYRDSDDFSLTELDVRRLALLATGSVVVEQVTWAPTVELLTGVSVNMGGETAAGVLVIRLDPDADGAWALSYGMGFQMLDSRYIDPGFGQRVAVRSADPETLRSLTRTTSTSGRERIDRPSRVASLSEASA
jgi:uncharacterized protein (TIGR04141 family)